MDDPTYEIVFEDESLMVIDKAAGLVVHPAPGHDEPTLAELLSDRTGGGDPERAGIVHRLDRGTSGLMLVARDPETHSSLQGMIAGREVGRTYAALVAGTPRTRSGTIDAPIGRSARARHRMAVGGAASREAVTRFEVAEAFPGAALLEVRLETGRTHQIRVHMQAIGHPLVGDEVYGGPMAFDLGRPFLHSKRITFRHPSSGEEMEFESELPGDLSAALDSVRENGLGT